MIVMLNGCGGGESCDTLSNTASTNEIKGFLIDAPVGNVDYVCGTQSGKTTQEGTFVCDTLPVEFKIGNKTIFKADTLPSDKKLYLQDILGLKRTNFSDENLLKLAMFLQSLDDDGNISEFIWIDDATIDKLEALSENIDLETMDINQTQELIRKLGKTPVSLEFAQEHLEDFVAIDNPTPEQNETPESNQTNSNPSDTNTTQEENQSVEDTNTSGSEVSTSPDTNESNTTGSEVSTQCHFLKPQTLIK